MANGLLSMPSQRVRPIASLLLGVLFLTSMPVRVLLFGQCPCGCDHHDEPVVLETSTAPANNAADDGDSLVGQGKRSPVQHHHHHHCDCHNRCRVVEYTGERERDLATFVLPPSPEQIRFEPVVTLPLPPVFEFMRPPRARTNVRS